MILLQGDCRETLKTIEDKSVQCCITSPPYFQLRSYLKSGHPDKLKEIGQEPTVALYVKSLVDVFREVRRVLKDDGIVWLNLGDSYNQSSSGGNGATGGRNKSTLASAMPPENTTPIKKASEKRLHQKNLLGIPWRVAFALQDDGWILRSDIIWAKRNCMPESVTDRPTRSHEYIFLLSKSARYYYNHEAIMEPCIYDVDGTGTAANTLSKSAGVSRTVLI